MSKLANLYCLFPKNGIWILLLSILLINSSFLIDKKKTDNNIRTIVIDPGHGGKDSGTMGTKRFKIYEKHIALAVSLKLGNYIKKSFPEIEIIYLGGCLFPVLKSKNRWTPGNGYWSS